MQAENVAEYLAQHPDFFDSHVDLLDRLSVTHPTNGQAISLIERQLLSQREKFEQVQSKLAELVAFGEENDAIAAKVHRLAMAFLMMKDFETTAEALYSLMQESFSVPHIALRIWGNGREVLAPEQVEMSESLREWIDQLAHPYCDILHQNEVREWFGESGSRLQSVAMIPLRREGSSFGLIALASEERERFYPQMGTLYVSQIGELTSAALLRYLD